VLGAEVKFNLLTIPSGHVKLVHQWYSGVSSFQSDISNMLVKPCAEFGSKFLVEFGAEMVRTLASSANCTPYLLAEDALGLVQPVCFLIVNGLRGVRELPQGPMQLEVPLLHLSHVPSTELVKSPTHSFIPSPQTSFNKLQVHL